MAVEQPRVTVVIPCYRQAHFLRDAIQSALDQTYPATEVIVVNDGSPDDTSDVARQFGDRVMLIEQPNTGLSGARNAGILRSCGEFIALLDSDDRLHPTCVEHRVALLVADPEAGAVTGGVRFVDEQLVPLEGKPGSTGLSRAVRYPETLHSNVGPTCGTLVRRRALDLCGLYDPMMQACEDWDAMVRISTRFRVLYDPEAMADLREVRGSMSRGHETMWDMAGLMMLKTRAYAPSQWSHFVHSRVGMFYHLLYMMNRVRSELSGASRYRTMAAFAMRRPSSLPYFAAWFFRLALNTVLRPFGRAR